MIDDWSVALELVGQGLYANGLDYGFIKNDYFYLIENLLFNWFVIHNIIYKKGE